ncbi:MAG: hypothetical protein LBM41_02750 [Ruminococcus sp.]|jgi:hypothetical protein|nr:hypothetical protein [Ruminococcus sp.]
MNMKKTIAAVAATALAITALAVPANAEVENAAALGTKFTYSLLKTNNIGRDGSVQVQTQTTALNLVEVAYGDPYGANAGFLVSLDGVDLGKEITITVLPGIGIQGTAFNASFILDGSGQTFIPAGIDYIDDGFVNNPDAPKKDIHGTQDDFLVVYPGTVGFDGEAVITVKGTAIIPIDYENTNYENQAAATAYIQNNKHTFDVYGWYEAYDEDINPVAANNYGTNRGNAYLLGLGVYKTSQATGFDDEIDNEVYGFSGLDSDADEIYFTDDFRQSAKMVTGLSKPTMKAVSKPYKSTLNGGLGSWVATGGNTPDVIEWLQGKDTASRLSDKLAAKSAKALDNGDIVLKPLTADRALAENNYVNVQAVLNDCITSYPNVTFTFNTAKENIITAGDYIDFYSSASSSAASTDKYKNAFGQSLYNLYGDEGSGNQPFDPAIYFQPFADLGVAYNLFSGALIINDTYTMQLADTNVFAYNGTSLTFDYDSLRDNVYTSTNTYLDLIHSMKLATSVPWYWDSLDVAFTPDSGDTGESEAAVIEIDELI